MSGWEFFLTLQYFEKYRYFKKQVVDDKIFWILRIATTPRIAINLRGLAKGIFEIKIGDASAGILSIELVYEITKAVHIAVFEQITVLAAHQNVAMATVVGGKHWFFVDDGLNHIQPEPFAL